MSPTTVFFDWGGTLAQSPDEFVHPWLVWSGALAHRGSAVSESEIRSALEAADRAVRHQIYAYLGRSDEYWRIYDRHVMDALHIASRRQELEESVQEVFDDPSLVRLFPESRSVLTTLRTKGYRTGLISNHHDGLRRIVEYLGMDECLDSITYSQEAGAEKPDPAVFSLALRRAGCDPSEAFHVGDSIEADVEGARRSGISPVWLNRRKIDRSPGCPILSSLDELIPLIERIG